MKTPWNRTGKIKAALIAVIALFQLFVPVGQIQQKGLMHLFLPFLFSCLYILISCVVFSKNKEITAPDWNENPLFNRRPLVQHQFAGFFFLSVGVGMLISSQIHFGIMSDFGLISVLFGTGTIVGMKLTLLLKQQPKKT